MLIEDSKKLSPLDRFVYWIKERNSIRTKKVLDYPKPWTNDVILQSYRFCNVQREHDTVTDWIRVNWREPNANDPNLWFALVVARLVNWPETLGEMGYVVQDAKRWNKARFLHVMKDRAARKKKLFTGAYMIHADAKHGGTKAEYLAEAVLDPLWKDREYFVALIRDIKDAKVRDAYGSSPERYPEGHLQSVFDLLRKYRDMGEFMAGQVIADLKYTPPLEKANDWWTWATPGPGSRRGLNRYIGRLPDHKWSSTSHGRDGEWHRELHSLIKEVSPKIELNVGRLHAQDYQNCLCEYDKYCRVLFGEGKPRSKYPGAK